MSNDQMTLDELLAYCTDGHRPEREIPVSFILPVLRDLIARAERAEAALARVEAVRADAELRDVRFHDLRHTFASRLIVAGMPIEQVSRLMGHTTLNMTYVYVNVGKEDAQRAARLLEQ